MQRDGTCPRLGRFSRVAAPQMVLLHALVALVHAVEMDYSKKAQAGWIPRNLKHRFQLLSWHGVGIHFRAVGSSASAVLVQAGIWDF